MKKIHITTHANLALIKYWGKRDEALLLPCTSSFGISLTALKTTTTLYSHAADEDLIQLDGNNNASLHIPIRKFFDGVRTRFGINTKFSILSKNHFPTASGLASSASGFAALALGVNSVCELGLSMQEISVLARTGSGSAARSIHGGVVLWHKGQALDGHDSFAQPMFNASWWPELRVIIAVTTTQEKKISSRAGATASKETSSLYPGWLERSKERLPKIIEAVRVRNFHTMGQLAEADWTDMRDVMLDTKPSLNYWTEVSWAVINKIIALREQSGLATYITTDAGPHVKVLCLAPDAPRIQEELRTIPGVLSILESCVADEPTIEEEYGNFIP